MTGESLKHRWTGLIKSFFIIVQKEAMITKTAINRKELMAAWTRGNLPVPQVWMTRG